MAGEECGLLLFHLQTLSLSLCHSGSVTLSLYSLLLSLSLSLTHSLSEHELIKRAFCYSVYPSKCALATGLVAVCAPGVPVQLILSHD